MRAIVTVAAIVALALTMGAVVAALTGAEGLAVAATAVLVLVVAVVGALALFRLHRAQRTLGQTLSSVQRTLETLSRGSGKQTKALSRVTDRIETVGTNVHALSQDVARARAQAGELLEAQEFRIVTHLEQQVDRCAEQEKTNGARPIPADVAAAVQLVALYRPVAPISPAGPPASQMLHLLRSSLDVRPQRILTVDCGEQTLWLAYALPTAQIVALVARKQERALRAAIAKHEVADRVEVYPASMRRPDVAHYYDEWFDPAGLTGSVDLIVLGEASWATFPAIPLLADVLAPDGVVLLPEHHDSPVEAWCASGLAEIDEDLTAPPVVALRLVARGRRTSAQ